MDKVDIGVFGGSGFASLLDDYKELDVKTPYGKPTEKVIVGDYSGKKVAFLPRHGHKHQFPPHKIPYKANIMAFKQLGVKRIFGPCAAGSLQPDVKPGDFVICDQFIDRTKSRGDTFYDGPTTTHISTAEPYCPQLRDLAVNSCKKLDIPVHDRGTVVVIEGPRFSTKAESKWFSSMGWGVINMTQVPECVLAREQEMCYANISLITDYDAGLEGNPEIRPVNIDEVLKIFKQNNEKLKTLIFEMIKNIPDTDCECRKALEGAVL